jgi:hypothetical protein
MLKTPVVNISSPFCYLLLRRNNIKFLTAKRIILQEFSQVSAAHEPCLWAESLCPVRASFLWVCTQTRVAPTCATPSCSCSTLSSWTTTSHTLQLTKVPHPARLLRCTKSVIDKHLIQRHPNCGASLRGGRCCLYERHIYFQRNVRERWNIYFGMPLLDWTRRKETTWKTKE